MATRRFIDAEHMADWLGRESEEDLATIAGVFRAMSVRGVQRIELDGDCVFTCEGINQTGRQAMAAIADVIELHLEAGEDLLSNFEDLAEQIDAEQAEIQLRILEGMWER